MLVYGIITKGHAEQNYWVKSYQIQIKSPSAAKYYFVNYQEPYGTVRVSTRRHDVTKSASVDEHGKLLLFSLKWMIILHQWKQDKITPFTYLSEYVASNLLIDIFCWQTFVGNTDKNTAVTNMLANPVIATFIRILPKEFNTMVAMRVEVLGCLAGLCFTSLLAWAVSLVVGPSTTREPAQATSHVI